MNMNTYVFEDEREREREVDDSMAWRSAAQRRLITITTIIDACECL